MIGASTAAGIGVILALVFLVLVVIGMVSGSSDAAKKAAKGQTKCENCGGNLMESGFGKLPEVVGTCKHCGHRQSWVKAS